MPAWSSRATGAWGAAPGRRSCSPLPALRLRCAGSRSTPPMWTIARDVGSRSRSGDRSPFATTENGASMSDVGGVGGSLRSSGGRRGPRLSIRPGARSSQRPFSTRPVQQAGPARGPPAASDGGRRPSLPPPRQRRRPHRSRRRVLGPSPGPPASPSPIRPGSVRRRCRPGRGRGSTRHSPSRAPTPRF